MPAKNVEKVYVPESYYHIFNRGVGKQNIFKDEADYVVFLSLLKRYLSKQPLKDNLGRDYPNYHEDIKLLAFCLMPNHFHLMVYQVEKEAVTKLLRAICTSYTMYFNKRYKRPGHLFQGVFKAKKIDGDSYLIHISRYIHMNPSSYSDWEFSSLPYYLKQKHSERLNTDIVLTLFEGSSYQEFLRDYISYREELKIIKNSLADN